MAETNNGPIILWTILNFVKIIWSGIIIALNKRFKSGLLKFIVRYARNSDEYDDESILKFT